MLRLIFLLTIICYAYSVSAQSTPQKNAIRDAIHNLNNDEQLKNSSIGFYAVDMKTGYVYAEINAELSLVPASTQKLITTASALEMIGDDYRFETHIAYSGFINKKQKSLEGNIYIIGGGDPCLGSHNFYTQYYQPDFMQSWVNSIKKLGIDTINGAVIADSRIYSFDMIPATWTWEDMGNYYGTGACGLSIYDNVYMMKIKSGNNNGSATSITEIVPYIPGIYIENNILSSSVPANNSYIFGAPYTNTRILEGTIPKGRSNYRIMASIPDPAYLAAYQLEQQLIDNGIVVKESATTIRRIKKHWKVKASKRKIIQTTKSPALFEIIKLTNKKSINLYAEHCLKHIGRVKKQNGDVFSGVKAIKEFWQEKGMDISGLNIEDGCGLSRYNSITAKQLVFVLCYMQKSRNASLFRESLPVAGQSGTLRYVCAGTSAAGKISAKSGSMRRVRAYSGYVDNKYGKKIVFAILVNNYNCSGYEMKKKLEKLFIVMVNARL